ncbi:MAG: 3'-5' exonuclease [Patescibacteria group bacterium]|nr:3'-5' exonuclease [Patescibacteria group bacterium]
MEEMELLSRSIAITDVETTGLDPHIHEIVEIGLLLINQRTFKVIDMLDIKVRPKHLETASEYALNLNGYRDVDWLGAMSLREAMAIYGRKTKNAIFCAHNTTFDWSFVSKALKETEVENLMDYHRVDLFTMAWLKLKDSGLKKFHMNEVAKYLGIPEEPMPHRAIRGVMVEYEIYKKLSEIK